MTNDASRSGKPATDSLRPAEPKGGDWERAALERVAARHVELHETRGDEPDATPAADWERRALERLRRYFRSQR